MQFRKVVVCFILALYVEAFGQSYKLPYLPNETWSCDQGNGDDPNAATVNTTHLAGSSMKFAWDFNWGGGSADLGKPYICPRAGTVSLTGYHQSTCTNPDGSTYVCGWGNHVVIKFSDGRYGKAAHLSKVFVKDGESVAQGQVIGFVGGTPNYSPHIHWQEQIDGGLSGQSTASGFSEVSRIAPVSSIRNTPTSGVPQSGVSYTSANTSLFDQAYTATGSIPLSNYGWWETWTSTNYSNVYYASVIDGFSNGHVVYDPMRGARSAVHIHGSIWTKWSDLTGPNSYLGSPLASRYQKGSLWYQDFQGGYISLNGSTASETNYPNSYGPGAFNYATQSGEPGMMIEQIPAGSPVVGWSPVASYLFSECYKRNDQSGTVGYPSNSFNNQSVVPYVQRWDIPNSSDYFYVQYFSGGSLGECLMMYDPKNGGSPVKDNKHLACLVKLGFKTWYLANNGISTLGAPLSDEYQSGNYTVQDFQKGYLIWNGSSVGVEFFVGAAAIATKQVSFTSSPTGASIWDRGRLIGVAPVTDYLFKGATYTVTAKLSGYQETEATFTVNADITVNINLTQTAPLTVTYPNGNEVFNDGQVYQLTWTGGSFSVARIEVSRDNGATWTALTQPSGTSNSDHFFNWAATTPISGKCRIKVSDNYNPNTYDVSDGTFSIGNVTGPQLACSVNDLGPVYVHAGDSTVLTFNVLNIGTGSTDLSWTAAYPSGIKEVDPDTGIGTRNVGVDLNFTGKTVGTYEDNITISSNGGTKIIPVRYTIDPAGVQIIFADGFNRSSVGSDWTTTGSVSIQNGQLELAGQPGTARVLCSAAGNHKDVSVEFDLGQPGISGGNQITGIYLQYVDSLNYSVVTIERASQIVALSRYVQYGGVRHTFPAALQPGKYFASVANDTVRLKNLNSTGTPINIWSLDQSIPSLGAGKIGFYAAEETRTLDNIVVREIQVQQNPPAPSVVGLWNMAGSLGSAAKKKNEVTGNSATETTISSTTDHLNVADEAYLFNGSGYLTTDVSTAIDGLTKMTVEAWVKTTSTTHDQIMGRWLNGSRSFVFNWFLDNRLFVYIASSPTDQGNSNGYASVIRDANWHYLAFVYDGSLANSDRVKIYWDGQPQATTITGTIPTIMTVVGAGSPFVIGNLEASISGPPHSGSIDWVKIHSVALTATQVSLSYQNLPPNYPVLSMPAVLDLGNGASGLLSGSLTITNTGTATGVGAVTCTGSITMDSSIVHLTAGQSRAYTVRVNLDNVTDGSHSDTVKVLCGNAVTKTVVTYSKNAPASVIGHWNMAGAAGSTAKRKNEITNVSLTESNMSSSADHRGVADEAYSFSGSGYLVSDLSTQIDGLTKMTVEAWIKTTATSHDQMIGRWQSGGRSFLLNWFNDNRLYIYIANSVTDQGSCNGYASVSRDANWHYIAFVYNGTQANNADRLKLYYDGQPQTTVITGTIPTSMTSGGSSYPMIIGNYEAGTGGPNHTGAMDFVKVHNVALTTAQINASYQSTLSKQAGFEPEDVTTAQIPKVFHLYQSHPNPFNPVTTIRFDIPQTTKATLTVYNIIGQKVAVLVDGNIEPGTHRVVWDATRHPSGIYFYVFNTSSFKSVRKMAVVK